MTDETRQPRPLGSPRKITSRGTSGGEGAPEPGARRPQRRPPGAGGRVAVAGLGIAAMLGLVANMEVADGRAKAADPASSPAVASQRTAKDMRHGLPAGFGQVALAKADKPIILTPHAVVHAVGASSSGGSGNAYSGGSGYATSSAPAAAPAAAPVASSSGSH
jgi:hypothetical protein